MSAASKPICQQAYPAIVNFTTASLEPAAASSGWKSGSLPMTLTPTMVPFAAVVWAGYPSGVQGRELTILRSIECNVFSFRSVY